MSIFNFFRKKYFVNDLPDIEKYHDSIFGEGSFDKMCEETEKRLRKQDPAWWIMIDQLEAINSA